MIQQKIKVAYVWWSQCWSDNASFFGFDKIYDVEENNFNSVKKYLTICEPGWNKFALVNSSGWTTRVVVFLKKFFYYADLGRLVSGSTVEQYLRFICRNSLLFLFNCVSKFWITLVSVFFFALWSNGQGQEESR